MALSRHHSHHLTTPSLTTPLTPPLTTPLPLRAPLHTQYEPHFDYGEACDYEENLHYGHRHVTMLVYLNSVPESAGGYTAFPKLNMRVYPQA